MGPDNNSKGIRCPYGKDVFLLLIKVFLAAQILFLTKVDGYRTGCVPHLSPTGWKVEQFQHNRFGAQDSTKPGVTLDLGDVSNDTHGSPTLEGLDSPEDAPLVSLNDNLLLMLCNTTNEIEILNFVSDLLYSNAQVEHSGLTHEENGLTSNAPGERNASSFGTCKKRSILYIFHNADKLNTMYKFLLEKFGEKIKINRIDSEVIELYEDSRVTLATDYGFLACYALYQDSLPNKSLPETSFLKTILSDKFENSKKMYLNGEYLCLSEDFSSSYSLCKFQQIMFDLLRTYLIDTDQFEKNQETIKTLLDVDLLCPMKDWISNNEMTSHIVGKNIMLGDKNVVIFSDFSLLRDKNGNFKCKNDSELVPILKKGCKFVGVSKYIYHPQHVRDWLRNLVGETKVAVLNGSRKFSVMNSIGSAPLFQNLPPKVSHKMQNIYRSKSEGVDASSVMRYLKKKSNHLSVSPISVECNSIACKLILKALESIGVDTVHKLKHSTEFGSKLRANKNLVNNSQNVFECKSNTMEDVIQSILDLGRKRCCRGLIEELSLQDVLDNIERPSCKSLIKYIKECGIYPAVLYSFDYTIHEFAQELETEISNDPDFGSRELEFDGELDGLLSKLLKRSVAFLSKSSDKKYSDFVRSNAKKFRIILTDHAISSGRHYLFLNTNMGPNRTPDKTVLSNVEIYNYTLNSDLVTFTSDLLTKVVLMAHSIYSPMYINFKDLSLPISQPENELSKRSFLEYLKRCKRKFDSSSTDIVSKRDMEQKIKKHLENCGLDIPKLMHIEESIMDTRINLEKYYFTRRSASGLHNVIIKNLHQCIDITGSTVIGHDGEKYTLKYFGYSPLDIFTNLTKENRELMAEFQSKHSQASRGLKKQKRNIAVLTSDKGYHLIIPIEFIKDILSLGTTPVNSAEETESVNSMIDGQNLNCECGNLVMRETVITFPRAIDIHISYILAHFKQENAHKMNSILDFSIAPKGRIDKYQSLYRDLVKERDELLDKANENVLQTDPVVEGVPQDVRSLYKFYSNLKRHVNRGGLEEVLTKRQTSDSLWGTFEDPTKTTATRTR